MTLISIIKTAQNNSLLDEDDNLVELELLPGMTDDNIAKFASTLPCPLPDHIRSLLQFCQGFEGCGVERVDFIGAGMSFAHPEVFPHGIPIASDGYGNFWVADLNPTSTDWAPIYFACHDAPVILYQSPSLEHFLTALLSRDVASDVDLIDDVHEDRRFQVWGNNPSVLSYSECLQSGDSALSAFARTLDSSFQFIDLRRPAIGFGFSWGRYGPDTVIQRHDTLPLFAYKRKARIQM